MCGIFGVIFHGSKHNGRQDDIAWAFSALATEAAVRGTDATGLARVEQDGYIYLYKNVVPSYTIVQYRRWWRPLGNVRGKTLALLGHTRWGTHGENTLENAHPFLFHGSAGKICGIHNGVISNYAALGPSPPLENDSANLFHGMAETRKENWPSYLRRVNGSMAIAWADGKSVYLARNSGNPCVLGYVEEIDATFFASTENILRRALEDSVFVPQKLRHLPVGEIHEFAPGHRDPVAVIEFEEARRRPAGFFPRSSHGRGGTATATRNDVQDDGSISICETCGREHLHSHMFYNASIRGYECQSCNPRRSFSRCEWCQEAEDLTYNAKYDQWLCDDCGGYMKHQTAVSPPRSKAAVIACDNCGNEYSETMLGNLIHVVDAWSAHLCSDCYETQFRTEGVDA